jgi:hypothetical protein
MSPRTVRASQWRGRAARRVTRKRWKTEGRSTVARVERSSIFAAIRSRWRHRSFTTEYLTISLGVTAFGSVTEVRGWLIDSPGRRLGFSSHLRPGVAMVPQPGDIAAELSDLAVVARDTLNRGGQNVTGMLQVVFGLLDQSISCIHSCTYDTGSENSHAAAHQFPALLDTPSRLGQHFSVDVAHFRVNSFHHLSSAVERCASSRERSRSQRMRSTGGKVRHWGRSAP